VSTICSALADPTRRRMLQRLAERGESRVTELARPFQISLPAISRHLRVLEKARLIRRQRRGREHLIRANPRGMQELQKWIVQCIAGWEFSFDKLDGLLASEQGKEKP
jgi:DNA-binding transcriptional ArsR family regulator